MKNFIQYIDETYTVKTKEVSVVGNTYTVSGIDVEFFILSLFVQNKRVDSVNVATHDNLMCNSVINDLGIVDLNTITKNHFFTPLSVVDLYVSAVAPPEVGSSDGKCCTYGIVRPTFVYSKDLITKNSKFIRFYRDGGDSTHTEVFVGGYHEVSLEPYFKSYNGGYDLSPDTSFNLLTKSLFSLDDMFFRFEIETLTLEFDVYFVVNPDSNTFSFFNSDPLYIYCECSYKNNAVSDTLRLLSSNDEETDIIRAFVRWKNVPELEVDSPE